MSDYERQRAKELAVEAAILKELSEANGAKRDEVAELLQPGDRVSAGEFGYVQVTDPKPALQVVDWEALTKWIEDNAPDVGLRTTVQIAPGFVSHLIKEGGEWTDPATGEVVQVPGLGLVRGKPVLRVVASDAAHETARALLGKVTRELEAGQ